MAKDRRETENTKKNNIIKINSSKELEERNREQYRKARLKSNIIKLTFILVIAAIILIAVIVSKTTVYKGYKVVTSNETVYESNAEYIEFGGNLLKYTPEGVSYINANGDTVWAAGVDMKQPIAKTAKEYAVIADKGGNTVRVFNTDGAVDEVIMPFSICDIDVATQGAFSVVLESDKTNYINMYSSHGDIIYEMQTSIDKSGYPLDISISEDGQKLFTSFFYMEGIDTRINLAAYNFGEVGQNTNADRMVGGFVFEDELIPKVEFVSNDTVAAFSDQEIIIYSMKEKPSERGRIKYESEIRSIFYSEKFIGTIEKEKKNSNNLYLMKVYNFEGTKLFDYSFSLEYEKIHATADEIIITGGPKCLILNKNGKEIFKYTFDTSIKSMIPTSKKHEYIITFDNRTETIKLKTNDTGIEKTEDTNDEEIYDVDDSTTEAEEIDFEITEEGE